MHWSDRYLGLPYADANCAQLAVRVQREVFGRELLLPDDASGGPFALSDRIAQHHTDYGERTANPREGDAVLMRVRGRLNHIGIYCVIRDTPWVLHALKNARQTCRHRLHDLQPLGIDIEGFYRWL